MDSVLDLSNCSVSINKDTDSLLVDPFLVEALQNPRHRLTILRMELDIQKFLQSPEESQFEFQHYPTSYLRLAAHRVAQHYGLQTIVLENPTDVPGTKIVAIRTPDSKHPSLLLSDIPTKESDNSSNHEKVKIAIRRRPSGMSSGDGSHSGMKRNEVRSVEERKEEYDKARARIFSGPNSPGSDEVLSQGPTDGNVSPSKNENGGCKNVTSASEKSLCVRDVGTCSRVAAIFKDSEKDRSDPDYDRSYDRYVRSFPSNQRFLPPFTMPKYQLPLVQYEAAFPQMGRIPGPQTSPNYGPSADPSMNPYCTMGLNQGSRGAVYMQWPSPTMMYAHSYEQLRHNVFQVPFCQQPLSFDYTQNH